MRVRTSEDSELESSLEAAELSLANGDPRTAVRHLRDARDEVLNVELWIEGLEAEARRQITTRRRNRHGPPGTGLQPAELPRESA